MDAQSQLAKHLHHPYHDDDIAAAEHEDTSPHGRRWAVVIATTAAADPILMLVSLTSPSLEHCHFGSFETGEEGRHLLQTLVCAC